MYMYVVKIRRHQHTRVHAHTGRSIHLFDVYSVYRGVAGRFIHLLGVYSAYGCIGVYPGSQEKSR